MKTKKIKAWAILAEDTSIMSNIEQLRMLEIYETRASAKRCIDNDIWTRKNMKIVPVTITYSIPSIKRKKKKT